MARTPYRAAQRETQTHGADRIIRSAPFCFYGTGATLEFYPSFMIGIGHGLALSALAKFVPDQPQTPGLKYTQRDNGSDGSVHKQGAFIVFAFGIMSEAEYQAHLAQCGTTSFDTRAVTIYAQNENYEWHLFDGTAVKAAEVTRRVNFLYDVPLLIRDLEQLD